MIWEIDEATRAVEGLDVHGRPVPAYAASLGLVPAPFGRRVAATLIEVAIVVVLQLPLLLAALPALMSAALSGDPQGLAGRDDLVVVIVCAAVSSVLTTAFIVVQLVLHGRRGVTVGKAFTGLRSVNVRTLERPGFWRGAVVRYLVLWGSFLVPLVGPLVVIPLSPFFDPQRRGRGWADLAAATWFVDAREGLNPYDEKRMRIARKTAATDLADEKPSLPSLATAAAGTGAYIPLARSHGGVLGAPKSEQPRTEAAPDAAAAAPSVPTSVASTPAPTPVAFPSSPAAPSAPTTGGWVPPTLLPDAAAPAPSPVPAAAKPAAAPAAGPVPAVAATGTPADAATSAAASAPAAALVLDTGETIAIDGAGVLLGRAPATRVGDPELTPVPVADPSMSISKTHLAVLRLDGALYAVDRGSTNGSALERSGMPHPLAAGQRVRVQHGDTIRFGDRHALVRVG